MKRTRTLNLPTLTLTVSSLLAGLFVVPTAHSDEDRSRAAAQTLRAKPRPAISRPATVLSPSAATVSYAKLPLAFETAAVAAPDGAKFLARGNGYAMFLAPNETFLMLGNSKRGAALHFKMLGANADAALVASDELPGKSNYFLGNVPANWRTNVPNYRKVAEHGVYEGIDVVYYGKQRQLEYDFVVAPGADTHAIQIAFEGAEKLRVNSNGDLVISVPGGDVQMHKPAAYQGTGDAKHFVEARYVRKGARGVSFELARYDAAQQLTIDPVLSYSTYLGGSNIDGANAIAVAPDNTVFIAGGTFSLDFPTAHPLQPSHNGPDDFERDAFVAKISADGSTLLYSTYLGGSEKDFANGIAVDFAGNAYVTGTTLSADFPITAGSFNEECGDDARCGASLNPLGLIVSNAFVTKLNQAGTGILYSGFLGGYENVEGHAIAVDKDGYAYVTGQTQDAILVTTTPPQCPKAIPPATVAPPCFFPFPITAGAFQPGFGGGATDGYITKITPTGTSLAYSSYAGGSDDEAGNGVATDDSGNAYVAGVTYSANFPISPSAAQAAYGRAGDAFVMKVATRASGAASLVYSTYIGGSGQDQANGVAYANGSVFVAGGSNSTGLFPSAPGYAKNNMGQGDAFALKLDPAVSGPAGITWFTYLGGSKADSAAGVGVDPSGNVYLTGSTVSSFDFPIAPAAFQPTYGGGNADSFVAELDTTGTRLVYSSYLGGTNTEIAGGIAVDTSGSAYVTGQTCSEDFPTTNPLSLGHTGQGGNCDAYISKVSIQHGIAVNPAGLVFSAQSLGTTSGSQTLTITNGDAPVTITSIAKSGPQAADFTVTNGANCVTLLAPGAQCSITVTFNPTAGGIRKAAIAITAKDALNNVLPTPVLNLTGSTSTVTLSSSSLNFGTQSIGDSSSQSVTVSNTGAAALAFSSITASGDFSETNNCTVALQPGSNCVINVTYKPTSASSSIGALTLTDNGSGSPQIVSLTGTGAQPDFVVSGSQSSATLSAGQSATYSVSVSPSGSFSSPVSFTCTGLPREASCTISPNPVTPSLTAPSTVTVTVSTTARTSVRPVGKINLWPATSTGSRVAMWLAIALLLFITATFPKLWLRPGTLAFGFAVALLLVSAACAGGNQSGVPSGTPAGNYPFNVTATSGSLTHSVPLNLQVN